LNAIRPQSARARGLAFCTWEEDKAVGGKGKD
jgi:hypothetical protein